MSLKQKHVKCGQQKHGFNWFNQPKCGLNQRNCWLNKSEIVFTNKNWDLINKNWIKPTNLDLANNKSKIPRYQSCVKWIEWSAYIYHCGIQPFFSKKLRSKVELEMKALLKSVSRHPQDLRMRNLQAGERGESESSQPCRRPAPIQLHVSTKKTTLLAVMVFPTVVLNISWPLYLSKKF